MEELGERSRHHSTRALLESLAGRGRLPLIVSEDTEGYDVQLNSVNEREFVTERRGDKVEALERMNKEQNDSEA